MATQSSLSHKRTDSGVDGTDTIPGTLATAQSFCTAVSSFTSERGFQAINELVQLAPQRELEIKKRDETIQDLNAKLIDLEKEHNVYNRQQLSNFEGRYDEWKEENTSLQDEVEELETALKEKDSEVATLQSQLGDFKARVDDLETEHVQMTKRIKERGQQLGDLEARSQRTQADMNERVQEIANAHGHIGALQRSLEGETEQHRVLKEEANKTRVRLKDFMKFSVKITELELPDVIVRLEKLWQTAINLANDFFACELPDQVLKSDWTGLRENDIFKHQIPLPQSNTAAARRTRAAVVLGALTRLVDKFVFQPTYLLDEESGLREILRDQAAVDPFKERYTRGILLSMSPEEQEANSEGIVHLVAKELLEDANARTLLAPEALATFLKALDAFVRQCREEWKIIQRGKQKLEPGFVYSTCTSHPWRFFEGTHPSTENGKRSEKLLATTNGEDNIVVIPRIYLVGTKAEPDPITCGYVLRRGHIDAAAEEMDEIRKNIPSAPFTQATSSRHRNRPTRTLSVTGENNSFLA